jgi:hypothetical protein
MLSALMATPAGLNKWHIPTHVYVYTHVCNAMQFATAYSPMSYQYSVELALHFREI